MLDAEGRSIRDGLLARFREPLVKPMSDHEFDTLAVRIFSYQYERNPPFAAFCRRRERTPREVRSWRDIPAVPTAAFKEVELVAGDPANVEATFRTSGTTQGRRGMHRVLDLSLYHGALLPNFREHVVPDLAEPLVLSLIPSPTELPDSSLSHMIGIVMERLGASDSGYFAGAALGLNVEALEGALRECQERHRPAVLLGTSFAFVHWLDAMRGRNVRLELPEGSRIMDTGGYKGRSREVSEDELRASYASLLGIEPAWSVNEYGMTELCSQFYDTTIRERLEGFGSGERRKAPPPWVRTMIVDPETLEPSSARAVGLLRHVDLANLGSVVAVQTEDLGEPVHDGFRVLGRAAGATPRGCSIAMDELLAASRDG